MRSRASGAVSLIAICIAILAVPSHALAEGHDVAGADRPSLDKLISRLDALEARVNGLEARVATLTNEKETALRELGDQRKENAELKTALSARTAGTVLAAVNDPGDDRPRHPISAGFRAGYTGFPFGQKEGGFFYGLLLDRRLIDRREGMPYGDLDLELGASVARSGSDQVLVHSSVAGGPVTVDFRQRMISIWPGLKYRLDSLDAYGVYPYLTGGPGVWVDIIETPPLVGGLQFPTQELAARKIPRTEGASLFEGAQGGAGVEFSLAHARVPVLNRMTLGFDYRYSAWTTGQRFSAYSMTFSYRD